MGIATGGIGLLLGSVLGKALGGLFGTKTTIKGQGLYGGSQDLGSILTQGFDLKEYVNIQTKKKAFGGALGGAFASGLLGASAGSALGIGLGIATGGIS